MKGLLYETKYRNQTGRRELFSPKNIILCCPCPLFQSVYRLFQLCLMSYKFLCTLSLDLLSLSTLTGRHLRHHNSYRVNRQFCMYNKCKVISDELGLTQSNIILHFTDHIILSDNITFIFVYTVYLSIYGCKYTMCSIHLYYCVYSALIPAQNTPLSYVKNLISLALWCFHVLWKIAQKTAFMLWYLHFDTFM